MARPEPIEIVEGWWIPQVHVTPPRWVLVKRNERVYYSRGGDTHFECSLGVMRRWIRRTKAQRASSTSCPSPLEK